jgi:predicted O-linked N-acetylglucosamine transferase (SPINDLY family)
MVLSAWRGELDFFKLFGYSSQLEAEGSHALAAVLYQTWARHNQTPYNHCVYFNLGVARLNERDVAGAQEAYQQAIQLAPAFVQPRINLGLVYERQGNLEAAITEWRWVDDNATSEDAEQRSLRLQALNHLGRVLEGARRYAEALTCLTKSLKLEPNQPDTIHHWVFLRQRLCAWPIYDEIEGVSLDLMRRCTSALAMLSLSDDPAEQLEAARNYVQRKLNPDVPVLPQAGPYHHKKLRIAYCSGDFCLHPVSMLTAELFELHDREQFEIYGFCWSPDDRSALRDRVIKAMDHFIPIGKLSDEAAARLIREHEIDILVDLQGQTLGARAELLAYRPAPVQITYLGLPATTGLPSIDYVIADRFLIPEEHAQHYSEKPLYMPDVYQVSDRLRRIGPTPTRQECGLPAESFVFCSFNNNYKCTPEVFEVWMKILHRVPASVLWLLADNPATEANLKAAAQARGVEGDRLIFAQRIPPEHYLARYRAADLFLDSFPFNAGTTANDALWVGLPVLTCAGRTFASRMAGALLTAAGLKELITYNLQDYEEAAVALANAPARCKAIREHLTEVQEHGVLFDTPLFVRNLEAQFKQLVNRP